MSARTLANTLASGKGELGVKVTTSTSVIHRGDEFRVEVTLTNSFQSDAIINGWSWTLPPPIDVDQTQEEKEQQAHDRDPTNPNKPAIFPIPISSGGSRTISFPISSMRPFQLYSFINNTTQKREWHFAGKWPKTGSQTSHFNLFYALGAGQPEKNLSVPVDLEILANPYEIYLAAFAGGIIGSLVNAWPLLISVPPVVWPPVARAIVSGVLGFFLVLISQRRSSVQLGISVEDAIGGLVVGFLVGYVGTAYFKGFLPTV